MPQLKFSVLRQGDPLPSQCFGGIKINSIRIAPPRCPHARINSPALLRVLPNDDSNERSTSDLPTIVEPDQTSSDDNDAAATEAAAASFVTGNAYLLVVSILWGSYTPALRAIFTLPGAPTPLVVAAARGVLQAAFLGTVYVLTQNNRNTDALPPPAAAAATDAASIDEPTSTSSALFLLSPAILGGVEIGLYNTFGTLLQTWGLSMTTATRSAFLIQSTALWTPLLAAVFGLAPPPLLWVSSGIALLSTLLVTADQIDTVASGSGMFSIESLVANLSIGDIATLGAALCYSLSTVRIPMYMSGNKGVIPLQLALGKSTVLATVSTAALIWSAVSISGQGGAPLTELWPAGPTQTAAWGIILWSAVGPGALSAYLHVKGQSMVGPTDAQIIFATVPLWSAVLAAALLPSEPVGVLTWIGGGCMVLAALVAAFGQSNKASNGGREKLE